MTSDADSLGHLTRDRLLPASLTRASPRERFITSRKTSSQVIHHLRCAVSLARCDHASQMRTGRCTAGGFGTVLQESSHLLFRAKQCRLQSDQSINRVRQCSSRQVCALRAIDDRGVGDTEGTPRKLKCKFGDDSEDFVFKHIIIMLPRIESRKCHPLL
jgi:hypothetical protein